MKVKMLNWLRCPVSGGKLELHTMVGDPATGESGDVREGFLFCPDSNRVYPIISGVPRLINHALTEYRDFYYRHRERLASFTGQQETLDDLEKSDPRVFDQRSYESFSLQWQQHTYGDDTWFKADGDQRRQEFLHNMQLQAEDLRGKLVIDGGCGNGHLTASVATHYGAEMVGMDFSRSVERAAARFPHVHFLQGNLLEPPFAPNTFDHGHTSGVLHHTPDPLGAFRKFQALVRPRGHVHVQLYRYRSDLVGRLNIVLRSFTTRLPVRWLWGLCHAAVPLHTELVKWTARLRGEKTNVDRASYRTRAVSLFDNYSPPYQFRYRQEEIQRWFEDAGFHDIKDVSLANEARHMLAFVGTRS